MSTQIAFGFVFGRMWAQRRGVKSVAAQNRAGLMMGVGGITPVGAVLANTAINTALDNQKPPEKPGNGDGQKESMARLKGGGVPPSGGVSPQKE